MNDQPIKAEENVIDLEERRIRKATGGGGPPKAGDWLAQLPNGSRFLAREIGRPGSEIDDFVVTTPPTAIEGVVLLAKNVKGRDGVFEWHDTKMFSQNYKQYCILEVIEYGGDQQVQQGRLDGDAEPPKPAEVHDGE
jgi:hypothetical protein